jgi:uncharacterized protein with ParB-like and HNH nuclease domain
MKTDSYKIAKVFSSGGDVHYVLPQFQREYTWEKKEWQTLLTDALALLEEMRPTTEEEEGEPAPVPERELEHFLGSLVVIGDGTRGMVPTFKLVDGQQRLTTISLLLCALARLAADTHARLAGRVHRLLVNDDEEGDLRYKILPTTKFSDRSTYTAILDGGDPPQGSDSRIGQAFNYFLAELSPKLTLGTVDPEKLFQVLTNSFQVVFIDLNRDESPYKIFESLNGKGKPLTQADLVRNYIAMKLPATGQERVFDTDWAKVEDLLQERRQVGRSRLGELTAFLRHYLALHTDVLCSEEHVYARFRDRAERKFISDATFAQEIATLRQFAEYYDRLLRPEREPRPQVRAALERLSVLEISTAYPFLLAVWDAQASGALTEGDLLGILVTLENYLVRRFLAGEPTNYLNKVFPVLWGQIELSAPVESLKTVLATRGYPTDVRLQQVLATRPLYDKSAFTRDRTALVLETVNRHLSVGTGGYTVLSGAATIEHILPQTPGPEWLEELGADAEATHRELVHNLGNLTLVTQEWNSSLSNAPFAIKQRRLANHALKLNRDYFSRDDITTWDGAAIRARGAWLTEQIFAVWPAMRASPAGDGQNAPAPYADFHQGCVERIERHLHVSFRRLGYAQWESTDGAFRLVVSVSKQYDRSTPSYWFAFHPSQRTFLEGGQRAFVAYGCGSPDKVVLIPLEDLLPLTPNMNTTSGDDRQYYHVKIYDSGTDLLLAQPVQRTKISITRYLLQNDTMK